MHTYVSIVYNTQLLGRLLRSINAIEGSMHHPGDHPQDWCDGSPVGPLARKSFQLHAQLARELDVDIGYRPLDTLSASIKHHHRTSTKNATTTSSSPAKRARVASWEGLPDWCDAPSMKNVSTIGTQKTTAQVWLGGSGGG